ncbi:MAG: hypothetical protein NC253_02910 [Ruminococcus sp.]|nr:hypothetical protein [Ruminococcus sp.]MCM1380345.1 hypothetical protein [Muribaculaceae bacterium]MCM1478345.1 hypothetical protein [Muribaculaceae bacterium]
MELERLPQIIAEDFRKYTAEKSREIDKAVRKRTAEALADVSENSPVRKRVPKSGVIRVHGVVKENMQPGAYKKGWIKYVSTARTGRTQGYVRNKTNYQLVHLLELGHRARDGGAVNPIPHVNPAEEKARAGLAEDIDSILSE